MPKAEKLFYRLYLSGEDLKIKSGFIDHIILRTPIGKNKKWSIKGVQGIVNGKAPSKSIKYECGYIDSAMEKLFGETRKVLTTKCVSNLTPTEVITTKYASGVGLIRRQNEFKGKNGETIDKSEIVIKSSRIIQ